MPCQLLPCFGRALMSGDTGISNMGSLFFQRKIEFMPPPGLPPAFSQMLGFSCFDDNRPVEKVS
jgi:hypothetical protein